MFLWPVVAVIVLFGLLTAWLYFAQGKLVFFPSSEMSLKPDQVGLRFEELFIDVTPTEKLHGWYFPVDHGRPSKKTVLFFHGNAGNISHRLETASLITELGAECLLIDYRGYGRSDGSATEENCYADAKAAYDWLRQTKGLDPDDIVLFGRSLGGAVAIDLATRIECGGLIVESTFSSIEDMGKRMYPFLPVRYLVRYRFDALEKISRVNCPVLVTHSPEDDMVPFKMGRKLYQAAAEPSRFIELSGGHNDPSYFQSEVYRQALTSLIFDEPKPTNGPAVP